MIYTNTPAKQTRNYIGIKTFSEIYWSRKSIKNNIYSIIKLIATEISVVLNKISK